MNDIEQPATVSDGVLGSKSTHPAYAAIRAHRISGSKPLFASNVGHYGFVRISINKASLANHDGYHESVIGHSQGYIEVDLSEAQWVAFISRMSCGSGTPCTLNYFRDGDKIRKVPGLPDPTLAADKIRTQAEQMAADTHRKAKDAADELRAMLASKLPKKLLADISMLLDRAIGQGQSCRDFQSECLTETKEKLVAESKVEIDAMVSGLVTQLGLSSIRQLGQVIAQAEARALQIEATP